MERKEGEEGWKGMMERKDGKEELKGRMERKDGGEEMNLIYPFGIMH